MSWSTELYSSKAEIMEYQEIHSSNSSSITIHWKDLVITTLITYSNFTQKFGPPDGVSIIYEVNSYQEYLIRI